MKKIFSIVVSFIVVTQVFAGVDAMITVEGVVGTAFDKNKVQVYDTLGQTYFLPRNVFPAGFVPTQARPFSVEVSEKLFDSLDIKKSDKKIKVEYKLVK